MQICPILTTRSWALQDKETHLSKNRSVVIRLESQYRSRTINMRGELEVPPLLRQHCWPSTPAVSVSPAADTNANSERQEEGKREKDKVCISVRDMGRQGAGGGQVQSAPRGVATRLKAWKRLLKIYTPARHFNVSNIQTICLKKNKLLPRSKGTEAPWSRPLYVSLHCSLSMPFEDRFHYNNILNQSLNSLSSQSFLFTVWVEMT